MSPEPNQNYTRRILLAVSGLSPQIVTETLYGLAINRDKPFIPTEIHLITTEEGAHRARLNLLHQQDGYFHRLCQEYELPSITFGESEIHTISDGAALLSDIRTETDNEIAADTITAIVRQLCNDPKSAIHASIAGGRKTMGYYLGYAMSLFGRTQDRLSHVLVQEHYESHKEFFYPTLHSRVIHTRDNRPLDTKDATVMLADIPFLRLREDIPESLLLGESGFAEIVNRTTRQQQQEPHLYLDQKRELYANEERLDLPPIDMAFYLWVIMMSDREGDLVKPHELEPEQAYSESFVPIYRWIYGDMDSTERTEKSLQQGMSQNFFSERVARINKRLREQLGKKVADSGYIIFMAGKRGSGQYRAKIDLSQCRGFDNVPL
ncbi:TIGR02584 family CRISPR-associated protein [Ectothiorhodospiraceae bacterium BW-2]|nr:TIGR02584 family CRISPR-associated protein [Ectothiorhodospiraceae bacterium BW-2]